jgi:hypothetical protein
MWRVLRGLYLLAWWAAVVLGVVAAFWAWKMGNRSSGNSGKILV